MSSNKSEIRKDYIQEKYVIIAPKRGLRSRDLAKEAGHEKPSNITCVFCPANIDASPALRVLGSRRKNWLIKVVKNKFPAVSTNNPRAYGLQEVVIETPDHRRELEDLPISRIAALLKIYAERTIEISKNKRIQYILIFKNDGGRAGASLHHAHSQIFATEFLPPHLFDKSIKMLEYKLKHGRCVYCDVINKEQRGPRLVWEDKNVVAFTPYASMHNYEVWILPKRHLDNITELNDAERKSWAIILKRLLKKISALNLPYNYYFHEVIFDTNQHLYMKITPRGSVWAGVEIGSGIIINPIAPEDAAR